MRVPLVRRRHHEDAAAQRATSIGAPYSRDSTGPVITSSTRAQRRLAAAEVQHPVQRAQQRVQLVRAEQHGDAELALQPAHQPHHLALPVRVEADQRLVQQQQAGRPSSACASSRRCRSPPDSSASGRRASARAPTSSSARPPRAGRPGQPRQAPAVAAYGGGDEVPAAQPQRRGRPDLRHVADRRLPRRAGRPSTSMRPAAGGSRPRIARISVVLPAPFGPSTPMNSLGDREADAGQHRAAAERSVTPSRTMAFRRRHWRARRRGRVRRAGPASRPGSPARAARSR